MPRNEGFIKTANLTKTAENLANVLVDFGVFGDSSEEKRMMVEKRGFIQSIKDHLLYGQRHGYLELTYSPSSVRLIIMTDVLESDGFIRLISAHDHPDVNPKMDYDGLDEALKALIAVPA